MITIIVVLLALIIVYVLACFIPVMAFPLLDIIVGAALIVGIVRLIKKLFKKD